jgi:hypothetical protein
MATHQQAMQNISATATTIIKWLTTARAARVQASYNAHAMLAGPKIIWH